MILQVISAMKAQPNILENLPAVVSHFLSIVHTMHQRCSSSLEIIHPSRESNTAPLMALLRREVLFSSEGREYHGCSQLHEDFLEVMDFINDAIASMDAFINAYKQAAVYFCCPVETSYGNEELLGTLARLHDSLLPSLQRGFEQILTAQTDGFQNSLGESLPNIDTSLKMLSMRIVKFGWKLLELCYLSDGAFEGSHSFVTCAKMFPAKVEDAVIRGDILVQAFRELSLGVSHNVQETQKSRSFLQKIERNYSLLARVYSLCDNGWISMDGEQLQYLSCILVSHFLKATNKVPNVPSTSKLQMDEDAAITESKISQIKDLFPDYGKGFLSACLEVYNQNPEEVIQRILDGTLHEDLLSLDVSLEKIPPPKSVSSLSRDAKGKGALMEPPALAFTNVVAAVKDWQTNAPSSSSSTGRFTRKSKVGVPETEILDSGSKESMKTAILASQYEYEDEYDDSFDDLGMSLVESGFEETETLGDRINSTPGKSWGAETEDSNPNTSGSRWNSRKKPQFYVKDGKNYSYKVSGSVAVSSSQEAALVNQAQKELIHGLGRGGNLPIGAVKKLIGSNEQQDHQSSNVTETERRENIPNSRGRGRRGGGGNHHRKDRAMKKHFAGSSGY
ncbi:PREDICTED: uncharacterized protein LOC104590638 isoform X1 [Nelumbo nucifera]|uniref:Uncharacterized protein LOC104590638 isoform X1 n=1 Tax=Nelumbo nucifera TaxID=4432 RepID=A0A1U8PZW4_NELNU|nr:PREDICTED: uncharacterized protein LOC104590638 isoform X1 [Nelumbo nucifera]